MTSYIRDDAKLSFHSDVNPLDGFPGNDMVVDPFMRPCVQVTKSLIVKKILVIKQHLPPQGITRDSGLCITKNICCNGGWTDRYSEVPYSVIP